MLTALSVGLRTERGTLPSVRKLPGLLSTSSYIKGLMENPLDKSGPAMINVCDYSVCGPADPGTKGRQRALTK